MLRARLKPSERLAGIDWAERNLRSQRWVSVQDHALAFHERWPVRQFLQWLANRAIRRIDRQLHRLAIERRTLRMDPEVRAEGHRAGRVAASRARHHQGEDHD